MVKKDPKLKSRNFTLHTDDISVLASYALTTKDMSLKKFAEKLLADKAEQIRKKQSATSGSIRT